MAWAKLHTEILGDPKLLRAARKGHKTLWLLPWFIAFAKLANDGGRLTVGRHPADPEDIAALVPNASMKEVRSCMESLLSLAILAQDDDGAYRFVKWSRRNDSPRGEDAGESGGREPYVYYALDGRGGCKIGMSVNPWARVNEMRTVNPAVRLAAIEPGGRVVEQDRHQQFAAAHSEREWFRLTPELSAHLATLTNNRSQIRSDARSDATRSSATEGATDFVAPVALAREVEVEEKRREEKRREGARKPAPPPDWLAEALDVWTRGVGHTTSTKLQRALSPLVTAQGWPAVKAALEIYVSSDEGPAARGRDRRADWFAADFQRWHTIAKTPLSDQDGVLTDRGRRLMQSIP